MVCTHARTLRKVSLVRVAHAAAPHYCHAFRAATRPRGTAARMLGAPHTPKVRGTRREHGYANTVLMQQ